MRRKEERSKQGQTNNKAKQHSTPNMYMQLVLTCMYNYIHITEYFVIILESFGSQHRTIVHTCIYMYMYVHVRTCTCTCTYMYMYIYASKQHSLLFVAEHKSSCICMYTRGSSFFSRKSDCLGCAVLLCLVCLFDLACFFLSSLILKHVHSFSSSVNSC